MAKTKTRVETRPKLLSSYVATREIVPSLTLAFNRYPCFPRELP